MTLNIVRGVEPAGEIWVIAALRADVKVDGRIRVNGRGLLLGGGNQIGFNGDASVFATLICEAVAPFTEHSTDGAGVALAPNGDFRIDDVLDPAPPADCDSPVLLIRVHGARPLVRCGHPEAGLASGPVVCPSNAGEQVLICNILDNQMFLRHALGKALPG